MTLAIPADPRRAALIMVACTALFAGTTLLGKALGTGAGGAGLPALQVSFGRFLFGFLGILAFTLLVRPAQPPAPRVPPAWGLHLARTLCGWTGVTLMFAAVAHLPLSDATAISFLSPVFTMLLAIPLLAERVGPWRWSAAAIALAGAAILLRPGGGSVEVAALLALGAAAAMGLEGIFIKRLSGREPVAQILLVNNAMGLAIATIAAAFVWQAPDAAAWSGLAAIGLIMVTGQALFLQAMRRADASFVAPLFYLVLCWAALYDGLVFGVIPDATSVGGAAIIVSGGLLLAWREGRIRRPPLS